MKYKKISIVRSSVTDLSSMSLPSATAVAAVLRLHYASVDIVTVNTENDLFKLAYEAPDLVFLGMKYVPSASHEGGKVWLSTFLDAEGIAYTGSEGLAQELELDKSLAKTCIENAGIATSPFLVAKPNEPLLAQQVDIAYPLFVKPTNRGGGSGIDNASVVYTFDELDNKVQTLHAQYKCDVLIETYLSGREFSVAVLWSDARQSYTHMPLEIEAPANSAGQRILSSAVKTADTETVSAVTDKIIADKLMTLSKKAFAALGARDYGRIDMRMDSAGTPYFLEANLIPSLLDGYGNFSKACTQFLGLSYEAMILRITKLGLRHTTQLPEHLSFALPLPSGKLPVIMGEQAAV